MEATNRWYSHKEVFEYPGVSRDTIFKWIKLKKYLPTKWGDYGSSS